MRYIAALITGLAKSAPKVRHMQPGRPAHGNEPDAGAWRSAGRPAAQRPADLPLVAERVGDPAQPPAVLVGHLAGRAGPGRHRLAEQPVRVVGDEQDATGGTADRLRAEARPVRAAG